MGIGKMLLVVGFVLTVVSPSPLVLWVQAFVRLAAVALISSVPA
jgi:hypothetical protein